jgi:hypothetical protein
VRSEEDETPNLAIPRRGSVAGGGARRDSSMALSYKVPSRRTLRRIDTSKYVGLGQAPDASPFEA